MKLRSPSCRSLAIYLPIALMLGACVKGVSSGRVTEQWIEVRSENLLVRTDLPRAAAVKVVKSWQNARNAMASRYLSCAFNKSNVPMEFVLLAGHQDTREFVDRDHAGVSRRPPSMWIDGKMQSVMSYKYSGDAPQQFLHELTHSATALCYPNAGPWFNEGMANYLESIYVDGRDLIAGSPTYVFLRKEGVEPAGDIYRTYKLGVEIHGLARRYLPKLAELQALDHAGFYGEPGDHSVGTLQRMNANYAGSWLIMHMLHAGKGDTETRFTKFLGLVANGVNDRTAWNDAFGDRDLEREYERYADSDLKMLSFPYKRPRVAEPTVRAMNVPEVKLLFARLSGWSDAEGRKRAESLVGSALPDSDAILYRAVMYQDAGDEQNARLWLDRALQQTPLDIDAVAVAVRWALRTPMSERTANQNEVLTARVALLESHATSAFQVAALGEYYMREGSDLHRAVTLLDKAISLDATEWRTHAYRGFALQQQGRTDDALKSYFSALALTAFASVEDRAMIRGFILALTIEDK